MTFALIFALFLVVYIIVDYERRTGMKRRNNMKYRSNIPLQKKLYTKYYMEVIKYIDTFDSSEFKTNDEFIVFLDSLYDHFKVQDNRTESEKAQTRIKYNKDISFIQSLHTNNIALDITKTPILNRVFYRNTSVIPNEDNLYGVRGYSDGNLKYDMNGFLVQSYECISTNVIVDIALTQTIRDLELQGYSYNKYNEPFKFEKYIDSSK